MNAPAPGPRFGLLDGVFGAMALLAGGLSLLPGLPPLLALLLAIPLLYAAPGQPIAALLGVPAPPRPLIVRLASGRDIPDFLQPVFANRFFRVYKVRDE
jgi:hypothetical protein